MAEDGGNLCLCQLRRGGDSRTGGGGQFAVGGGGGGVSTLVGRECRLFKGIHSV